MKITLRSLERVDPAPGAGHGGRLHSLDSLRGIAAMAVVVYHMTTRFDEIFAPEHWPRALFKFGSGRYGVSMFFVLSGFVMLWSIRRIDRARDFAISRFSRLYPPLWVSMTVTVLVTMALAPPVSAYPKDPGLFSVTVPDFLANLTMVPTWLGRRMIDPSYWTLPVELGFYLMLGLALACKQLRPDRVLRTITVFWVVDVLVFQFAAFAAKGMGGLREMSSDYYYLFVAGMACFLLWERHQGTAVNVGHTPELERLQRWLLVGLAVQAPFVDLVRQQWSSAAVTALILVLFFFAVTGRLPLLETAPLLFLGRISYSLYLVHGNVGYVVQRKLLGWRMERNTAVLVTIAVSSLIAWAISATVERRVSPWLRRRLTAASKPGSTAAPA